VVVLLAGAALEVWPRLAPESAPAGDFEARVPVRQTLDVGSPVRLEFDGLDGSLSVKPGAPGKLEITAFKTADGMSPDEAATRASEMPLAIRREPDRVIFSARSNGAFPWSARPPLRVDYQIVAPEQSELRVVDGKGRVDAAGLQRGVDLAGEDLAVRLSNVGGVTVAIKRGGIVVDGADGPVSLRTSGGDIQVQHVSGQVAELSAAGGVIVAESEVAGRLSVLSSGKFVSLQRARGRQIEVKAQQGSIELTDTTAAEALRLEGGRGAVTVARAQAHPLGVTTNGGGAELTEVQGEVEVATGGGPVSLFGANVSSLSVSSGGGAVFFSGSLPVKGATSVDTGGGKLQLTVARESAFTLDADSGPGRLTVAQSLLPDADLTAGRARAPINGGGSEVVLRTRGGPLSITTR
jgi:hypothetical protein